MAVTVLTFAVGLPLVYATCGCLPVSATAKKHKIVTKATTLAAGEGQWTSHPWAPGTTIAAVPIMTQADGTNSDATPSVILGHPSEIASQPLEVAEGTDLSDVVLDFQFYGRNRA